VPPPGLLDTALPNTYIARPPERVSSSFQARETRSPSLRRVPRREDFVDPGARSS